MYIYLMVGDFKNHAANELAECVLSIKEPLEFISLAASFLLAMAFTFPALAKKR
jgi:hypothetical protein